MNLTDGEVAVLADQVGELIRSWLPDAVVEVRIVPATNDDPYRWEGPGAWTVYFDVGPERDDTISVSLSGDQEPSRALFRLVDGLDQLGETSRYRGVAFPRCLPAHSHAARVELDDTGVTLRCPETGEVVHHLVP